MAKCKKVRGVWILSRTEGDTVKIKCCRNLARQVAACVNHYTDLLLTTGQQLQLTPCWTIRNQLTGLLRSSRLQFALNSLKPKAEKLNMKGQSGIRELKVWIKKKQQPVICLNQETAAASEHEYIFQPQSKCELSRRIKVVKIKR